MIGMCRKVLGYPAAPRRARSPRRPGYPALVRAMAGQAVGAVRGRRGSVLVLILGAIAMLAVVTVAYVTVGASDRRTGSVVVGRDRVARTVDGIADYIARDVIGADALAVYPDGEDMQLPNLFSPGDPGPAYVREAWDAPLVDPELRSVLADPVNDQHLRFNPAGTIERPWPGGGIDPRLPSDPWLSSPEPVWLEGEHLVSPGQPPLAEDIYTYKRDWAVITTIGPSGNPVSLYNLRGNFDAGSGFSANPFPGVGVTNARMSDRLSLFDTGVGPATLMTWYGVNVDSNHPAGGSRALRPFYWTTHQRGAFRPALEVRNGIGPEDPEYLHYQWADADGDGMLDSRWFELVDVSDEDNPVSVLPRDDRFRWFVASRIIDLSGLVNVNTAIDFRASPVRTDPTGITPGDVDLRRLLRMVDPYEQWNGAGGYHDLEQPLQGQSGDYTGYFVTGPIDPWDVGDFADYALRLAIHDGTLPYPGAQIGAAPWVMQGPWPIDAANRADYYRDVGGQSAGASFSGGGTNPRLLTTGGVFGLPDLLELLTYWGVNDPATLSRLEQAVGGRDLASAGVSPLRDNRDLVIERGWHDGSPPGTVPPDPVNGIADDDAMTLAAFDVRRLLTPISWGRLLRSSTLLPGFRDQLDPLGDQKIDAIAALQRAAPPPPPAPVVQPDAGLLFAAYAEALLPHSWRTNAWNSGAPGDPLRTLAYGHDPVLAAWCAAHMTVNAIDMYDDDTLPQNDGRVVSALTLALSGHQNDLTSVIDANSGQSGTQAYPYWTPRPAAVVPPNQPRPLRPGTLDLDYALGLRDTNAAPTQDPSRMARQGDLGTQPVAMNVFGMEAQPFIAQVASFTIYTDAPYAAYTAPIPPNADEWIDPGTTNPPGGWAEITIRGNVEEINPDFICQVVAFQLTNPFDEAVPLTRTGTGGAVADEFYLELGGNYFKLAEVDEQNGALIPVSLQGRDPTGTLRNNTRTFYVLNNTLANTQERFRNGSLAGYGMPVLQGDEVKKIIERQLSTVFTGSSTGGGPPDEPPILIARMDPATGQVLSGFQDLFSATDQQNRVVKLWRVYKTANVTLNDATSDDILADRMQDPTPDEPIEPCVLDRRIQDGDHDINNTVAGPCPTRIPGNPVDNTGFSICLWATMKRSDDPRGGPTVGSVPVGAIPAYCVEVRRGTAGLTLNHSIPTSGGIESAPTDCDFRGGCPPTINEAVGDTYLVNTSAGGGGLWNRLTDLALQPLIPSVTNFPEDKSDSTQTIGAAFGREYYHAYPELHLNNDRFRAVSVTGRPGATMRIGDMLLPMCIGPTKVPDPGLSTSDQPWMTFGETLALALNYSDVDPADPNADPNFAFLDTLARDANNRPATDRGNLRLDRYVPFEDHAGTAFVFDPNTADTPRAPRVPLGATVLDVFRTIDPDLGSLERGVQGSVNLNTAPSRVLKALPMACPNPGPNDWWGTTPPPGSNLPQPAVPFGASSGSDYAAAIEAFRDKTMVTALDGQLVTFQESAAAYPTLDDPRTWNGRTITNQDVTGTGANVEPIREAPGLASLGELFGATEGPGGPGGQNGTRVPLRHQIDELGRERTAAGAPNPQNSGDVGVNSTLYGPGNVINQIRDDYAEKLAVAGSIAGTASVRSDTFACWMVIHGYQRSDCEGLSNTLNQADPLSPTIAKRYLMIVDRSNVTRLGDKPRILMMQEVPF